MALYPLMPNKMSVDRDEDGRLYYTYYRGTDEAIKNKEFAVTLQPSDVLHIPGLGFDAVSYTHLDMGFRNMLLGYRDADRGHIIENIVFLELLRRDYRVYIGKVGETEVDFVAEKPNNKVYICLLYTSRCG